MYIMLGYGTRCMRCFLDSEQRIMIVFRELSQCTKKTRDWECQKWRASAIALVLLFVDSFTYLNMACSHGSETGRDQARGRCNSHLVLHPVEIDQARQFQVLARISFVQERSIGLIALHSQPINSARHHWHKSEPRNWTFHWFHFYALYFNSFGLPLWSLNHLCLSGYLLFNFCVVFERHIFQKHSRIELEYLKAYATKLLNHVTPNGHIGGYSQLRGCVRILSRFQKTCHSGFC